MQEKIYILKITKEYGDITKEKIIEKIEDYETSAELFETNEVKILIDKED
jgi:hypothetical protein